MKHQSPVLFAKPAFTCCDETVDISDFWQEECDPENTDGFYVEGFFMRVDVPSIDGNHECFNAKGYELAGISIESPEATTYHDRAYALSMMGSDAVNRMEASQ